MATDLDAALVELVNHLIRKMPDVRWTREALDPSQAKKLPIGCVVCVGGEFRDADGAGADGALTVADVRVLLYLECSSQATAQAEVLRRLRELMEALAAFEGEAELGASGFALDEDEKNDRMCGLMLTLDLTI